MSWPEVARASSARSGRTTGRGATCRTTRARRADPRERHQRLRRRSSPRRASGLFSRCVPQNGHSSVTTLSSSSTTAPQPVHRVCVDRPAMPRGVRPSRACRVLLEVALLRPRRRLSSTVGRRGRSTGTSATALRGSNSTFAPHCGHGNSLPFGGAFVRVGSLSTGGAVGRGDWRRSVGHGQWWWSHVRVGTVQEAVESMRILRRS